MLTVHICLLAEAYITCLQTFTQNAFFTLRHRSVQRKACVFTVKNNTKKFTELFSFLYITMDESASNVSDVQFRDKTAPAKFRSNYSL